MSTNKVALVTGGSRGIGKSICLKLASEGFNIALVYASSAAEAENVVEEIRALGVQAKAYQCDVASFADTKELCKQVAADMGQPYALVNNAGITRDKLMIQMKEEDFDRVIDVNLKGAFNMIRHLYSGFMRAREGSIINITSVVGTNGNAGQSNYAAAKAGLIGLTKSVAKELAARNITCNAVAPGMIETDMTAELPANVQEAMLSAIPLNREGKAEEVASLVGYLASEKAKYITGTVIAVDGGLSI